MGLLVFVFKFWSSCVYGYVTPLFRFKLLTCEFQLYFVMKYSGADELNGNLWNYDLLCKCLLFLKQNSIRFYSILVRT